MNRQKCREYSYTHAGRSTIAHWCDWIYFTGSFRNKKSLCSCNHLTAGVFIRKQQDSLPDIFCTSECMNFTLNRRTVFCFRKRIGTIKECNLATQKKWKRKAKLTDIKTGAFQKASQNVIIYFTRMLSRMEVTLWIIKWSYNM